MRKIPYVIPKIPENEEPYPLPQGWKWVRLGDVVTLSKETIEKFTGEEIYIGLENFEKGSGLIGYGDSNKIASAKNIFHNGAILYGKLRPYLNKHCIANFDGICSTDISVFYANDFSLNKFIDLFLNTSYFIEYAVNNSKGINLPRVSPKIILNIPIPLPPFEIQRHIVNRLECLFSQIDESLIAAQNVYEDIGNIKKSILTRAFRGELS